MSKKPGLKYGGELPTAGRNFCNFLNYYYLEHLLALFSSKALSVMETFGYSKLAKNKSKKYLLRV